MTTPPSPILGKIPKKYVFFALPPYIYLQAQKLGPDRDLPKWGQKTTIYDIVCVSRGENWNFQTVGHRTSSCNIRLFSLFFWSQGISELVIKCGHLFLIHSLFFSSILTTLGFSSSLKQHHFHHFIGKSLKTGKSRDRDVTLWFEQHFWFQGAPLSDSIWWTTLEPMQVAPPDDQILNQCK